MNVLGKDGGNAVIFKPVIIILAFIAIPVLILNTFFVGWDYVPFFWDAGTWGGTLSELVGVQKYERNIA